MRAGFLFVLLSTCIFSACANNDKWPHGAMVSAANPYATDAAIAMLAQGGHAVDAAIAAHLVLGLVEPQSSGLGGGGFLVVYERDSGELIFHDGRETAPAAASADMFMTDGKAMSYMQAWQSGRAIGAPGAVALYKQAHDQHGQLPWEALFAPAIALAEQGFVVSPRLAGYLPRMAELTRLDENPGAAEYFYPQGKPLVTGQVRTNPGYAQTLKAIAEQGPKAFYTGAMAEAIVAAARAEPNPGSLSLADLANYSVKTRPIVCGPFKKLQICTASPPSSGGAQIMLAQLYENLLAQNTDKTQAFVDAQRLAYADRDQYFADPEYAEVPIAALLDPDYLQSRADQRFAPDAEPVAGVPSVLNQPGKDTTEEASGTTHLSIIDGAGNAISFTATVEAAFGSARWVQGFLLNNEMTDFARRYDPNEPMPANVIAPNKRPRSSMSPTFVFDAQGDLLMVTGSPGGNSIPAYVGKTIIGVLDWGLTPQQAVDYPNVIARGKKVRVETGVEGGLEIAAKLKAMGYEVQERNGENSGIHMIYVTPDGLVGAADKRREGTVRVWPED